MASESKRKSIHRRETAGIRGLRPRGPSGAGTREMRRARATARLVEPILSHNDPSRESGTDADSAAPK